MSLRNTDGEPVTLRIVQVRQIAAASGLLTRNAPLPETTNGYDIQDQRGHSYIGRPALPTWKEAYDRLQAIIAEHHHAGRAETD